VADSSWAWQSTPSLVVILELEVVNLTCNVVDSECQAAVATDAEAPRSFSISG